MIAIANRDGSLIKSIPFTGEMEFGFHSLFGFVSQASAEDRIQSRKLRGLQVSAAAGWLCRFRVSHVEAADTAGGWEIQALDGCEARRVLDAGWTLETPVGSFRLSECLPTVASNAELAEHSRDRSATWIGLAATMVLIAFLLMPQSSVVAPVAEEISEPITVKIVAEKAVVVPKFEAQSIPQEIAKVAPTKEVRRAIQQDLGFLGMLGKKNLTKALGGMPTSLKDASPGAGAGGKEGSGGEVLVGLGQGVKRVTVGNSGVAGLGGIGTKGRGGGAGGYGNSMVGSGEGRTLSSVPLSQDMILEGGLDRSVIQATIAKYLSQVRACYEDGLRKNPGLAGQVTVAFEVSGLGSVNSSQVAKSSLGNPQVEQCITSRMMSWKFPKPLGGVNVKVNYPFLLRPVSS